MRKRNGGGAVDEYFYKNEKMQNKHPEKISMRGQYCAKCGSRTGCDCRKKLKEASFGGEHGEEQNALMQALKDCGYDAVEMNGGEHEDDYDIYEFLEKTPKASLVCELVNKLHEYGYHITKK